MSLIKKAAVMALALTAPTRRLLNRRYLAMTAQERRAFWADYAKIFRRKHPPVQAGVWQVRYRGTDLAIPLRTDSMWLDWDVAVSIVANDWEVKEAYDALLSAAEPPELFLDIGSNNGTHAVLIASQGIEVLAFEPLRAPREFGQRLAAANSLSFRCEAVALGAERGTITIAYPEKETWLATVGDTPADRAPLIREEVPIACLDDYADRVRGKRVLIKIDVEGHELAVLKGGKQVLAQKPTIVFESLPDESRGPLWDEFAAQGLAIHSLPIDSAVVLARDDFLGHATTNFVARPQA